MSKPVIVVEHITKRYDLGLIGTGTLTRDLSRWWALIHHRPDPYSKIGKEDPFSKINQSILALDDVSFVVNKGESVGIIGRNGAGKSTILKILSRVTAPTEGTVKIKGRIGSLLEVGTGFHPELTGRENIFLNGAILGMRKSEVLRKFDDIVEFSGVEKFIDTPVKRYSSGMHVRLAFAVAAHLDPEILVIDEVLAVGDAEFQKKCLGKMGEVTDEGRTVLFVSHNMQAIQNFCERVLLIEQGKIIFNGSAEDAIARYLKSSLNNKTEITWPLEKAPGNKNVNLLKVWAKKANKSKSNGFFTINDDIEIGFQFINHTPGTNPFNLGLHLENEMGILVLSTNSGGREIHSITSGVHIAKCIIPAKLLNQGTYTISTLRFVLNEDMVVYECSDILSFDLLIPGEKKFGWVGKPSGVILTDFDWSISKQ